MKLELRALAGAERFPSNPPYGPYGQPAIPVTIRRGTSILINIAMRVMPNEEFQAIRDSILSGQADLYAYGEIDYTDPYGVRVTRFCGRWDRKTMNFEIPPGPCAHYTDIR